MPKEQIIVRLNTDVKPSGSDLAVVNAARRSFGKRSDWVWKGLNGETWTHYNGIEYYYQIDEEGNEHYITKELKDEDKNLIKFLARGMSAKDFEGFKEDIQSAAKSRDVDADEAELIELLYRWRNTPLHDTPFNHCHISFEVKAPIFVARQLVKTEYAPFSEFSRRYITDDVEFYLHDYREAAKDKKQGSGGAHPNNESLQDRARFHNIEAVMWYNKQIKEGVAPEQARGCLPTDLMTSWTWSATLGAFAKMCRERLGSDAQEETRYVAEKVYKNLQQHYPISAKALVEGPDS